MCQLFSCSQERRSAQQKTDGIAIACAPVGAFSRWGVGSFFVLLQPSCAAALGCSGLHQPAGLDLVLLRRVQLSTEKIAAEPVRKINGFISRVFFLFEVSLLTSPFLSHAPVFSYYWEIANKSWVTVSDLKRKLTRLFCTGEAQTALCHSRTDHQPNSVLSCIAWMPLLPQTRHSYDRFLSYLKNHWAVQEASSSLQLNLLLIGILKKRF